ncbi:hypothetical protein QUC31_016813 [Theobroma cacao]|uniref:F-box family protein n=1 Tax=Theobroma cacao TaxID=3641 RepID=A0A061EJY2_THECC|nr:F-box family protein [Theobroma cacao]WRX20320.1 F-box domain - like 10 [Theobroma cacao]
MDFTRVLPEECLCLIISLTSPRDACRSALVSPAMRSVADSDAVWERFLPCDYKEIISGSSSSSSSLLSLPKKDLYFRLSLHPLLLENGSKSFQLEKETGKKCYMLGARALSIIWEDEPEYWGWTSIPESRFSEAAKLEIVWWLEVKGKIKTRILSSRTSYAAYLVFKFDDEYRYGFRNRSVSLCVNVEGGASGEVRDVLLDPSENMPRQARERGNGWMEIEMGEFWNECGDDGTVECILWEVNTAYRKEGLIIEGIELRPKDIGS